MTTPPPALSSMHPIPARWCSSSSSTSALPTAKEPPGATAAIAILRAIPALPSPSLDIATEPGRSSRGLGRRRLFTDSMDV